MSVCLHKHACACMYVGFTRMARKKTRRSQKKPRIWDFEFSDFNSVSRTRNVTDTGILCLAVNEGSTEALQRLCSQTGIRTAHEAHLKAWDGMRHS